MLGELLVKLALAGKLEHEKDALLVMEITEEAKDMRMAEVLLNFDLSPSLLLDFGLHNFGFV
jgi:hypothetical protein